MLFKKKKTKNSVFPFKITEMGKCLQKHIAFSDYKVIFSSNLTRVNFKGISVDLRAVPLLTSLYLCFWKAAARGAGRGRRPSAPPGDGEKDRAFTNAFFFCHKEM